MWQVAWAHPKFGSLLASCSFDNRVVVWKEVSDNVWQQVGGRAGGGRRRAQRTHRATLPVGSRSGRSVLTHLLAAPAAGLPVAAAHRQRQLAVLGAVRAGAGAGGGLV